MVIIWLMMVNNNLVGGWATYPSEKWWSESQLGWWNSQYMDWHKIPWFQSTNQITIIFPLLLVYSLLTTIMDPNHQPVYLYYFDKKKIHPCWKILQLGGDSQASHVWLHEATSTKTNMESGKNQGFCGGFLAAKLVLGWRFEKNACQHLEIWNWQNPIWYQLTIFPKRRFMRKKSPLLFFQPYINEPLICILTWGLPKKLVALQKTPIPLRPIPSSLLS